MNYGQSKQPEQSRQSKSCERLTTRLAFVVVSRALLVGIILSFIQIFLDYRGGKQDIATEIKEVIALVKPASEIAIYVVDDMLTHQIASGLLENQSIIRVIITDKLAGVLTDVSKPVVSGHFNWLTPLLFDDLVQVSVPLFDINLPKVQNGELLVLLDLHYHSEKFLRRAFVVLISGFIRNSILALICIVIFYRLLTKPLAKLTGDIIAFDPKHPNIKQVSTPIGHEKDELGALVKAFNYAQTSLSWSHLKLKANNQLLEIRVRARTRDLYQAKKNAEKMARTDPLTGLNNRRAFFELAKPIDKAADRYGRRYSVLMIDIDHFKKVNDSFGHAMGDQVIKSIAAAMQQIIRTTDIPGRLGGEEFAIIVTDTPAQEVTNLAERLRLSIANSKNLIGDIAIEVTISVGIAAFKAGGDSLEAVMNKADQALYLAKSKGRNQTVIW